MCFINIKIIFIRGKLKRLSSVCKNNYKKVISGNDLKKTNDNIVDVSYSI